MNSSLFFCFLIFAGSLCGQTAPTMELWYYHHSYITSQTAVQQSEAIVDQAVAAGYNGMVLWDSAINDLQFSWFNRSYIQQVIQYAQSKGLKVMPLTAPYGHSGDMLRQNPNWAEGERVVGTQFQVDPTGQSLQVIDSSPGVVNGGFENGQTSWFSYGDAGTSVDYTTAHSGAASGLISTTSGNARLYQSLTVKPWRQYHLRMFTKTAGFQGYAQVEIYGDNNFAYNRVNQQLSLTSTSSGWTQFDYAFNSGPHTTMSILMGVWGGTQGKLWFDDISLTETALVYVLRGNSTPLNVYDPANPTHSFVEGTDFGAVSDPKFLTNPTFDDYYHQPMTVPVPAGSSLKPGQTVAMDWYALQPVFGDAGASLTDPGPWQWMQQNSAAVGHVFPNAGGYMFGYDEMAHMDSTASAKAMNMTPAQLLAWHFNQVYNLYKTVDASKRVYVWSDMFDPYHNAVNNYALVEGDLTGSWTGLPADVTIMNWNLNNLTNSVNWFSGLNPSQPIAHRQVIAGYYDSGNGASAASTELSQVKGIPGVTGIMYTTFADDYSQLGAFATAAKAGWMTYQASLPTTLTPLRFVPITPCRIADTRTAAGPFGAPAVAAQTTRSFPVLSSACNIPASAQSYSLNVTVVPQGPLGYLTIWPAGQAQPLVSTLNSDGRVKANAAIVPAGSNGAVSVYATNTTDVVLDINGYFVPATNTGALAFYPLTECRAADTRKAIGTLGGPYIAGGGTRAFPITQSACAVPANAQAYSISFTALPRGALGYLTTWATGQPQPLVSTLNAQRGTPVAAAAIVPAGTNGSISVFASGSTDLTIDINGYFAPAGTGGLSLYNVTPCRVLDSRLPTGSAPFTGTRAVPVSGAAPCGVPATAQGYILNATVVPSGSLTTLTLWPQGGTQPGVTTLTAPDGAITGNMAVVPSTSGGVNAYASSYTQLLLDIFGYLAP